MNKAAINDIARLKKEIERRKTSKDIIDTLDIRNHLAPVYLPLHEDIQARRHQNINLPGGRGSAKSSFVALEIVNGIMQDKTGESNAIVFRRTANTMRESVFSQIAWAVDVLDVGAYWSGNVSPMCWTYRPTGAQIIFRGLDDSSKLKSIKPRKGVFRFVWFEEFSELPGANFTRSVMQSVIRGGNDFVVFRSFNPPISAASWANVFIAQPDDRAITLHTTYLDIPREWLGDNFIFEADRLREINETAYRHEYLGEPTGSGGEVFPNIETREITDDEINQLQYIYCGIDWGFSVDPVVFMRVAYDRKTETVYFIDEIYKKHCSNSDFAKEIIARGYDYTGNIVNGGIFGSYERMKERQLIIADNAEPKSIADLQGMGLKVIACQKYPGCVLYRIKWLQSRRIVIDPKRTPNAHREFSTYEYLTDKDGNFLADVPDANNHCIDSVSYALDRIINQRKASA